jgi:hypothetical protein
VAIGAAMWSGGALAADDAAPWIDPPSILVFESPDGIGPVSAVPSEDVARQFTADADLPVFRFTPRSPRLASDAGSGGNPPAAFGPSGRPSEGGIWLDFSQGPERPDGLNFTLGAGVLSVPARAGDFLAAAEGRRDTTTVSARLALARLSLGGAVRRAADRDLAAALLPGRDGSGYDLDVSYSFDSGSLTLSRFYGSEDNFLLRAGSEPHERLSLSGRYLVGPGFNLTAAFAFSGAAKPSAASDQTQDGWALLTGLRLLF